MESNLHSKAIRSHQTGWPFAAVAVIVIGGLAAFGFATVAQRSASAEPAVPPGAKFTSWADNGKAGQRVLELVKGEMPAVGVPVSGVVKSDTNCQPDDQGIFHCQNVVALANGDQIEVVHNHAMTNYPCLNPDEKLTLARLNPVWNVDANWLVAKDAT